MPLMRLLRTGLEMSIADSKVKYEQYSYHRPIGKDYLRWIFMEIMGSPP